MDQAGLGDILETTEPERLATGFVFTEGPLWHPAGYWLFVDLRRNQLFKMAPGEKPELVRETQGGNGTTFDLEGCLIHCEGDGRIVTRMRRDGAVETIADRFNGGRHQLEAFGVTHLLESTTRYDPAVGRYKKQHPEVYAQRILVAKFAVRTRHLKLWRVPLVSAR